MIGIIVTGHGNFATGITSGLKLLAGEPEGYAAVDFEPEDSIEILTEKIEYALKELESCDGVVILTDLAGGSPYNVSIRLKMAGREPLEVIGGTNLPVLLDAYLSRPMYETAAQMAAGALKAGKSQLVQFEQVSSDGGDDDEIECDE